MGKCGQVPGRPACRSARRRGRVGQLRPFKPSGGCRTDYFMCQTRRFVNHPRADRRICQIRRKRLAGWKVVTRLRTTRAEIWQPCSQDLECCSPQSSERIPIERFVAHPRTSLWLPSYPEPLRSISHDLPQSRHRRRSYYHPVANTTTSRRLDGKLPHDLGCLNLGPHPRFDVHRDAELKQLFNVTCRSLGSKFGAVPCDKVNFRIVRRQLKGNTSAEFYRVSNG